MTDDYTESSIVYLASENPLNFAEEIKKIPARVIFIIYYDETRWNNFGYKTDFKFKVFHDNEEIYEDNIKFSFLDDKAEPLEFINQLLSERKANLVAAKDSPAFFTMLDNMEAYRNFTSIFTIKSAVSILSQAHDLICQKMRSFPEDWYEKSLNTKAFNKSFVRSGQSYFTFHNAEHILNGSEYTKLVDFTGNFVAKFKIDGIKEDYTLNFNFDGGGIIPKRMSVLIGCNGSGKSQSLHNIVSSLLDGDQRFIDKSGNRPEVSRVICISSPSELSKTFPRYRSNPRIPYLKIANGRSGKHNLRPCEQIIRLARLEDRFIKGDRWSLFLNVINKEFNIEEIALVYRKNIVNPEYDIEARYVFLKDLQRMGEERSLETFDKIDKKSDPVRVIDGKIYPMSSGEVSFVNLICTLCLHIENGSLILLDEPETHLHPNLISSLVAVLNNLLKETGSVSIIATHSVYFVREVPRVQVHIFKKDDNEIKILKPRLKTLGASIDSISQFIFEDEITSRVIENIKTKLKDKPDTAKELYKDIENELPSEAKIDVISVIDKGVEEA